MKFAGPSVRKPLGIEFVALRLGVRAVRPQLLLPGGRRRKGHLALNHYAKEQDRKISLSFSALPPPLWSPALAARALAASAKRRRPRRAQRRSRAATRAMPAGCRPARAPGIWWGAAAAAA